MGEANNNGELISGADYRASYYSGIDAGFNQLYMSGALHRALDEQARKELVRRYTAALDAGLNRTLNDFVSNQQGPDRLHPLLKPTVVLPDLFFKTAGVLTPDESREQQMQEAMENDPELVRTIEAAMVNSLDQLQKKSGLPSVDLVTQFAFFVEEYRASVGAGEFTNHIEDEMGHFLHDRSKTQ